ncbi:MAG: HD domain-containing protein, partial [Desulfobacteraceae bacterium]|nr:HD domain-containing protein [Desulfobacteraceae bacterium]
MTDYLPIKKSQIPLCINVPLFFKTADDEFKLYKKRGEGISFERLMSSKHPDLYIKQQDKDTAIIEILSGLNKSLAQSIFSQGLDHVKAVLAQIVEEALTHDQAKAMEVLPLTVDILFEGYSNNFGVMDSLTKIASNSRVTVTHTINVLTFTIAYCFYNGLSEKETKNLALCALLHDIGSSELPPDLLETDKKLTESEFKEYTTHTAIGHDLIILNTEFDVSVASVALEHHERIDGSGYPNGLSKLSFETQLIGMIDCYEPLTFREKIFRKAKKPFDSLQIIKNEVIEG